jgi:hypothetical protein
VPKLQTYDELCTVRFSLEVRGQLMTVSGATIDRLRRPTRAAMAPSLLLAQTRSLALCARGYLPNLSLRATSRYLPFCLLLR